MISLSLGNYEDGLDFITREFIEKLSFPHKLWITTNLETCSFINWHMNGTSIIIDYNNLIKYLNSTRSIFKIKEPEDFVQKLLDLGFVRRANLINNANNSALMQFEHEHFHEKRLDLLAHMQHKYESSASKENTSTGHEEIKEQIYHNLTENFQIEKDYEEQVLAGRGLEVEQHRKYILTERMNGDLCFMVHGKVSEMQKSRWNLQALHQFRSAKLLLQQKIKSSYNAVGNCMDEDNSVIELPSEMYENPYDSAMHMEVDMDKPDAVGYFGCADSQSVKQFYGNLLPTYDHQQNCLVPQISLKQPPPSEAPEELYEIKIELKDGIVITTGELKGNADMYSIDPNVDPSTTSNSLEAVMFEENVITTRTTKENIDQNLEYAAKLSSLPDLGFY